MLKNKKRWILYLFIVFVLFAVLVWRFCIYIPPLKISPETTFITEPLTADGKYIDYFKAAENKLYPPSMRTDDNGFRLLVKGIGIPKEYERETDGQNIKIQFLEKLGLTESDVKNDTKLDDSLTAVLFKYPGENPQEDYNSDDYKPARYDDYNKFTNKHGYWTPQEFPELEKPLKENEAGLNLLATAVRKKDFCAPYIKSAVPNTVFDYDYMNQTFTFMEVNRKFARSVAVRALYRIGTGDIDGAIDDIITLHWLARHTAAQGTEAYGLTGLAIEGIAKSIGINANPDKPAAKEQLQRLQNERRKLPPFPSCENCLEYERLYGLAILQESYSSMNPENIKVKENIRKLSNDSALSAVYAVRCVDVNILMRNYNKFYEKQTEETGNNAKVKTVKLFRKHPWLMSLMFPLTKTRSQLVSMILLGHFDPLIQHAESAYLRGECSEQLQKIGMDILISSGDFSPQNTALVQRLQNLRCPFRKDALPHYELVKYKEPAASTAGKSIYDNTAAADVLICETLTDELQKFDGTHKPPHPGGRHIFLRSGAVRFQSETESKPQ